MATFVHATPTADEPLIDPALDLARHISMLSGQDPVLVDENVSDSQVLAWQPTKSGLAVFGGFVICVDF